jgi:hypothetical protein
MFDTELLLVTVQQLFVTSTPFSCRGETSTDNVIFEKQFAEKKLILTPLHNTILEKSVEKQVYMAHNFITKELTN